MWIITVLIILGCVGVAIFVDFHPAFVRTGNKRVVKVTMGDGKVKFRCEEEYKNGRWDLISGGEFYNYKDANNFINQHLSYKVVNEKVVKEVNVNQ